MSQLTPVSTGTKDVRDLITSPSMLAQLKMALPRHIKPDRLARTVLTQIRMNPKLLDCSRESLLACVLQAAQLGLEPGILGQCWILPYGREATFIPGYRGLAQLAWRSGLIKSQIAHAVYKGDVFAYDFGGDRIEHIPGGETDPEQLTHAYAIIHTTTGGRIFDVMTKQEIERIKGRSPSMRGGRSSPWITDYAEMAKKSVYTRLSKLAPCSVEMQTILQLDEEAEAGIPQSIELPQAIDFSVVEAENEKTPAKQGNGSEGEASTSATEPESNGSGSKGSPALNPLLEAAIKLRTKGQATPHAFDRKLREALTSVFGELTGLEGDELDKAVEAARKIEVKLV